MQEELEVPAPPDLDEGAEQALGQLEEWREDEAVSWVFDGFDGDDDNLFEEESADEDYDGYSSDDSSTGPEASGRSAGRPNHSI